MSSDQGAITSPDHDVELDTMVNGACNLRSRGEHAAAERLERAAFRLWQIRWGEPGATVRPSA